TLSDHILYFNDPSSPDIYTLSLHDALPICNDILIYDCAPSLSPAMELLLSEADIVLIPMIPSPLSIRAMEQVVDFFAAKARQPRSEEHTSELQSRENLVCRLLLEKKKYINI